MKTGRALRRREPGHRVLLEGTWEGSDSTYIISLPWWGRSRASRSTLYSLMNRPPGRS